MLGERLRSLLSSRNISVSEFAVMCDLPVETVKNVYYGKTDDPKVSTVLKMANALNLSVNCLLGKCSHTAEERQILVNYRNCGKHGRAIIEFIARYEAGAIKVEREGKEKRKIPCLVPHGDIRKGIAYDLCETIELETGNKDAYIAIQLTNNDLAPAFCKNDIILFENRFPANGEKAAFYGAGRVYIRKYIEEEKQYRLKALHREGEDIVLKRMDEVDYIGTCIGTIRE